MALVVAGVFLCFAAVLRYRGENDHASGFGVIRNTTNLDLYGGRPADHRLAIALFMVGGLAIAGAVITKRLRPE